MKSLSKKASDKKEEKKETQKRSISDEGAKKSVVVNDKIERRMPGETLAAWKFRVGLSKEEPKAPKKIK